MTELEYGINVANKFDLLFGDEDPSEALSKAVDAKKKKADPKGAAPAGAVLKEKTARSSTGKPVEGKPGDKKVEAGKDANKAKPGQGAAPKAPVAGGQQQQQRPPRSAPQGGRPEQGGKENSSDAQRRPPQMKGDQQRSPAAAGQGQQGGPRRFGGPRPEGSAPPRRPAPMDHDFGGSSGPVTGDQEVPEQRTGFGGGRGFRGGASGFRGGRASPRHQYPREQVHGGEGGAPSHARGREFERHSGSNKTGVKPVQKREGGGSYNWGSYREDAEIGAEAAHAAEGAPPAEKPVGEEGAAPAEAHVEGQEAGTGEADPNAEPQVHEKTLKEWMEEEERNRLRPKYATRAANEGESEQKVFQKMRRVQREKANADGMVEVVEYVEVDVDEDSHVPAGGSGKGGRGGPFQLVFAPAARPEGGMRGGPRGGPRGGRGGQSRGGPRGGGGAHHHHGGRNAAPPAQDELNFPPLG